MTRDISPERKTAYYFGMAITIIGFLMFLCVFATIAIGIGLSGSPGIRPQTVAPLAFGGVILVILGRIIASLGSRGLAGSGAVLDPKRAREDLEPYSRMAGGMLKDALDEAGIPLGQADKPAPEKIVQKVIMIKCPACGKLNEEDSKFCQECSHKF